MPAKASRFFPYCSGEVTLTPPENLLMARISFLGGVLEVKNRLDGSCLGGFFLELRDFLGSKARIYWSIKGLNEAR